MVLFSCEATLGTTDVWCGWVREWQLAIYSISQQISGKSQTSWQQISDKSRANLKKISGKSQANPGQISDKSWADLEQIQGKCETNLIQISGNSQAYLMQISSKSQTNIVQISGKSFVNLRQILSKFHTNLRLRLEFCLASWQVGAGLQSNWLSFCCYINNHWGL